MTRLAIMIYNQLLREGQSLEGSNISCVKENAIDQFPQRKEFERKRLSLPSSRSHEEQNAMMQHQTSELLLSQVKQKGKLDLGMKYVCILTCTVNIYSAVLELTCVQALHHWLNNLIISVQCIEGTISTRSDKQTL